MYLYVVSHIYVCTIIYAISRFLNHILDDLIDVFIIYYTGSDFSSPSAIRFPSRRNTYGIRFYARPDGILEDHGKLQVTAYLPSHNRNSHNCSTEIEILNDSELHKF